ERGLPPLRLDERIDAAAGDRMHDMEDLGYWSHQSPDGRSPFVWLRPHAYDYSFAGENLACGFETSELLVDSWMESKGHRDNILSPFYTDCGIAIIDGSTMGRATGKSIVVMFGRQQNGAQQTASR
ncbi:MAG TPA: CAP domain-containing protein, partial [Thermoanaerobaculia bacterium]|nr:CAP domain-containing protein [Thermoanaerobaculia bacterium]